MPRVIDVESDDSSSNEDPKVEIDPELAWILDPFAEVPENYRIEKE